MTPMVSSSQFEPARQAMLRQLAEKGIVSTQVLSAMARVPRERFVPAELEKAAYADRALPIGGGQTISQPYIVALMTEAAGLRGGERVLDVGTGSGYQAAVLAEMGARVVSIERRAELSQQAARVLQACGYQNIELVLGDGTQGWPAGAPYDRILVAAAATHIPPALEQQLAEGGTLVIPLGSAGEQVLQAFHKSAGRLHGQVLSGCRFVPLLGAQDSQS